MTQIVYVYAIGRELDASGLAGITGVNGNSSFHVATQDGLNAIYSLVPAHDFSQQAIDARAGDLEWLSRIGYSHQQVNEHLAQKTATIPLRAFTLFTSVAILNQFLEAEKARLARTLARLDGRSEWTIRVELEPDIWSAAVVRRVADLRAMQVEAESALAGKAYLLKKKLDESKKKAAKEAEELLLRELEAKLRGKINGEIAVETRQNRAGSFPQINLLVTAEEAEELKRMQTALVSDYAPDGVRLVLTGPWPAYSFTTERS